ncbi:MAG: ABC transporter substrate-binding protein, partial [Chloroflexota bacterium]|nr:ABC transporter substrate-binding protein [Chloroflexota bacterium]
APTTAPVAPAVNTQPQTAPAGQLVIGAIEEPASLSPLIDLPHHFPEHVLQTLLFDSLTQYMPDGSVSPKLAQSWDVSSDNRSYTFHLNPRAMFQDGTPITADDVKFTFDAALDPNTNSSNEGLATVDRTEVIDPQTLKVTLKDIDPTFLAQGGARGIVPMHVLQGQDLKTSDFSKKPIGSGPYKLVSYTPGQSVVMEAVPDFYRGPAHIKTIVYKVLTDQNVVLTQLRSGELNYGLITPRDLSAVSGVSSLKVVEEKDPRFYDIHYNYQRPYFQDIQVRQALLQAVDRQALVDKVLQGHGAVMDSNVSPVSWAFNPEVPKFPFDPPSAKALLDAAGWTPGSDGVRGKDGQKLSFTVMIYNYDATLQQALLVVQQNLKDVGVDMQIRPQEEGVMNSRRANGEFDAYSRIWNPVYDPDQCSLLVTGNKYGGYSNPQADAACKTEKTSLDQSVRKPALFQIQQVLAQDVARLWLYSEDQLNALSSNVQGVQPHPVNFFWNMKDWTLGS